MTSDVVYTVCTWLSLHLYSHRDAHDINTFHIFFCVPMMKLFSSGNLTKHMKSKAHGKRCPEGTAPGPVQCELETDEGGERKHKHFDELWMEKRLQIDLFI